MKKLFKPIFSLLFIATIAISCSKEDPAPDDTTNPPENGNATELKAAEDYFNASVKSIVDAKCISCHTGHHSSGSSNYSTFANARAGATNMYNRVNSGNMPKGGDKLPDSDINVFKTFKDLVDAIP